MEKNKKKKPNKSNLIIDTIKRLLSDLWGNILYLFALNKVTHGMNWLNYCLTRLLSFICF